MSSRLTGGCGFVGANFVRLCLAERADVAIVVLDKHTCAGNPQCLADVLDSPRLAFVRGNTEEYNST